MVEVNVAVTLGLVCERAGAVWRGWNRETAWQGCAVLRWVFPHDFGRKSRTKRSFWRLDV